MLLRHDETELSIRNNNITIIIGGIIFGIGAVAQIAFWIIVLIKMFKTETSPLQGIIGIFCSLWAYIWGWMNSTKLGLKKTMIQWTVATILAIVGYAIMTVGIIKKAQENPEAFGVQPSSMPSMQME